MYQLVSIITPTYNQEEVIEECLVSVLSQTYRNWEMYVVDDGSTDATADIVAKYAAMDHRIKLLRLSHRGIYKLAETYNAALSRIQGILVAICEGDDYWPPEKLDIQVSLHDDPDVIFSHGVVSLVVDGKVSGTFPRPPSLGIVSTEDYLEWALLKTDAIAAVSAMIRRDALDRIGGFWQHDGVPAVDYSTWPRLFQLPGKVAYTKCCVGYWRRSASQVTSALAVTLVQGDLPIATDQYLHLDEQIKERLNTTLQEIQEMAHLRILRIALTERSRLVAFQEAKILLTIGSLKNRILALVGIVLNVLRRDFTMFDVAMQVLVSRVPGHRMSNGGRR